MVKPAEALPLCDQKPQIVFSKEDEKEEVMDTIIIKRTCEKEEARHPQPPDVVVDFVVVCFCSCASIVA